MIDFIILAILAVIAASIVFFLIRQKKQGVTCIGCPHGKQCEKMKKKTDSCGCGGCRGHRKEEFDCSDGREPN